jgi:Homeodomain-like domain
MHISAQRKFKVILSPEEEATVQAVITKGVAKARTITRARILKLAPQGKKDTEIIAALGVSKTTPYTIRKHFHEGG